MAMEKGTANLLLRCAWYARMLVGALFSPRRSVKQSSDMTQVVIVDAVPDDEQMMTSIESVTSVRLGVHAYFRALLPRTYPSP